MKQIIVVKPGTVTQENKDYLKTEGVIVIEHDNPHEVRVITPMEGFEADEMSEAMIETIRYASTVTKENFVEKFLKRVTERVKHS